MSTRIVRFKRRYFARLIAERSGISTVEFAFVTPVLLLLVMGIIEYSMIMFSMAAMESATAITARLGKTGSSADGLSRQQTIINSIRDHTTGLLDPNLITITTMVYPRFDEINDPEPYTDTNGNGAYNPGEPYTDINGNGQWDQDMGAAGLGNPGEIVVYTVRYPWRIMTPVIRPITGSIFNITVRTVVKNEPFGV